MKKTSALPRNWHTVEFTATLTLRIPHGPPKTAKLTRKAIEETLLAEGFDGKELARILANNVESFTWTKDK